MYASKKEVKPSPVWQGSQQNCRQRYAPKKERHAPLWQGRQRWQGKEPQTGNRDRTFGGAQKRAESAFEEIQLFTIEGRINKSPKCALGRGLRGHQFHMQQTGFRVAV